MFPYSGAAAAVYYHAWRRPPRVFPYGSGRYCATSCAAAAAALVPERRRPPPCRTTPGGGRLSCFLRRRPPSWLSCNGVAASVPYHDRRRRPCLLPSGGVRSHATPCKAAAAVRVPCDGGRLRDTSRTAAAAVIFAYGSGRRFATSRAAADAVRVLLRRNGSYSVVKYEATAAPRVSLRRRSLPCHIMRGRGRLTFSLTSMAAAPPHHARRLPPYL